MSEETSAAPAAAPAPRPVPPVDPPTPDSDGLARYRCSDDSEGVVRFGHYDATVRRSDNTTFTLPRARSLSGNGVDVYVGMGLVIERAGERLRVTRDANLLTCGPAGPG